MKFTTLFSAVALAAAMSVHADVTEIASDDFDSYAIPQGETSVAVNDLEAFPGWTVGGSEDASKIVATHFAGKDQALELSTNGDTLTFDAETSSGSAATVTMTVEMVASDAPVSMDGDNATHTALYLEKAEDATTGTLKAFSSDNDGNCWTTLATGIVCTNDDGEEDEAGTKFVADVEIVIDYEAGTATYTVNDVTYDAIPLANENTWASSKKLNSVAFKGTGFVDDLFVGEETVVVDKATFIYELAGVQQGDASVLPIETFNFYDVVDPEVGYEYTATLWERTNEGDTEIPDVTIEVAANGAWAVTYEDFTAVVDHTYVVKIAADKIKLDFTINFYAGEDTESELLDTVEDFVLYGEAYGVIDTSAYDEVGAILYENGDDYVDDDTFTEAVVVNVFGCVSESETKTYTASEFFASITWTAIDPVAGTAEFAFTTDVELNEGDEVEDLAVVTVTELGSEDTGLYGTVTLDLENGTGSVEGLPTSEEADALFLIGLDAAGEL